jgi:hypothetical protein
MRFFQTAPLGCAEDEGSIRLNFNDRADLSRDGYFSTTLYYRSDKEFTETDYYLGIKIYTLLINTQSYFEDVGFVIYTDAATYPLLERHFGTASKVLIAVVSWPRFATRKRIIENTILRCLRFQAKVLFPKAWIAVRDADTIFAYEINNALIKRELTFVSSGGKLITDITLRSNANEILEMLAELIGEWEQIFIRNWLHARDKIVLSTSDQYHARWHKEMPYMYIPKPLPVDPDTKNKDYIYVTERDHIQRFLEQGRPTFGVMLDAPKGVYAGFSHLAADAPPGFWRACCKYLTDHYKLIKDGLKDRLIISNTYSSIGAIGKDERMLLFGVMPKYFNDIYFVHLDYYGGLDFKERIISPARKQPPVLEHLRISTNYISIPNPNVDPVSDKDKRDRAVKIGGETFQTLILSRKYALNIYTFPYIDKYETADKFVLSPDGTMHEHFKGLFKRMLRDFAQFKKDYPKIGMTVLEEFGAPVTHAGRELVPALKNVVYEPIRPIPPKKVYLPAQKATEESNNSQNMRRITRAAARKKAHAKKTRRQPRGERSTSATPNRASAAHNTSTSNNE